MKYISTTTLYSSFKQPQKHVQLWVPPLAGISVTRKKIAFARPLSLSNIKDVSLIPCWFGIYSSQSTSCRQYSTLTLCPAQSDFTFNADMRVAETRQFCKLQDGGQSLIRVAMSQLNLLALVYYRILKLARTIADLAESEDIQSGHWAEALQYRPKLTMG